MRSMFHHRFEADAVRTSVEVQQGKGGFCALGAGHSWLRWCCKKKPQKTALGHVGVSNKNVHPSQKQNCHKSHRNSMTVLNIASDTVYISKTTEKKSFNF